MKELRYILAVLFSSTEKTEDVGDVKLQILNATGYAAVPASKLLLAAEAGAPLKDEDRVEYAAVEEMSRRVIAYGPVHCYIIYIQRICHWDNL